MPHVWAKTTKLNEYTFRDPTSVVMSAAVVFIYLSIISRDQCSDPLSVPATSDVFVLIYINATDSGPLGAFERALSKGQFAMQSENPVECDSSLVDVVVEALESHHPSIA